MKNADRNNCFKIAIICSENFDDGVFLVRIMDILTSNLPLVDLSTDARPALVVLEGDNPLKRTIRSWAERKRYTHVAFYLEPEKYGINALVKKEELLLNYLDTNAVLVCFRYEKDGVPSIIRQADRKNLKMLTYKSDVRQEIDKKKITARKGPS